MERLLDVTLQNGQDHDATQIGLPGGWALYWLPMNHRGIIFYVGLQLKLITNFSCTAKYRVFLNLWYPYHNISRSVTQRSQH